MKQSANEDERLANARATSAGPALFALTIGVIYLPGGIIWFAVANASGALAREPGLFGKILALLFSGPFLLLPIAILMFYLPRLGAVCLIAAGVLSGICIALLPDWMDKQALILLISVPMLGLGVWQLCIAERHPIRFSFTSLLIGMAIIAAILMLIVEYFR